MNNELCDAGKFRPHGVLCRRYGLEECSKAVIGLVLGGEFMSVSMATENFAGKAAAASALGFDKGPSANYLVAAEIDRRLNRAIGVGGQFATHAEGRAFVEEALVGELRRRCSRTAPRSGLITSRYRHRRSRSTGPVNLLASWSTPPEGFL